MKTLIKLLVAAAVLVLAYLSVMSIYTPVQFDKIQDKREAVLQAKLKAVADYESAYESVKGRYATAEELIDFLQNGKLYYVTSEGEYTDEMRAKGMTEAAAARAGLLRRDTTWIPAKDSLLKGIEVESVLQVLNTSNKINIEVGHIDQEIGNDTIKQSVFQATIPFTDYLNDLDHTRLKTKISEALTKVNGFPGLRIGSLEEVKITGNWE